MTDERISGIALIAGSVASIITMALHPTGQQALAPSGLHMALRNATARIMVCDFCERDPAIYWQPLKPQSKSK